MAESAVSQDELATDFANEAKSLQPKRPNLASDIKRKQLEMDFTPSLDLPNVTF